MNSNWFKLVMKMTKVEYGKNLLLKGVPVIFNKSGAKSFQGLCTRLVNKVLAYNLCIALNSIFGETCEIGKIKKLIF